MSWLLIAALVPVESFCGSRPGAKLQLAASGTDVSHKLRQNTTQPMTTVLCC